MNKKNIRLFSGCLLVLLCISALTGCGGSSSGTSTNSPGTNPSSGGPFTVRFDSKGGASVESQVVNGRLKLAKPDDPYTPDKPDYYFDGWYTSTAYSDKWDFDNDIVTSDLTLYARWKDVTNNVLEYYYNNDNNTYSVASKEIIDISGDVYVPGYHSGDNGTLMVYAVADAGFYGQDEMNAIYLPDCLKELGESSFSGCDSLTYILLPDGVINIPLGAFYNCSSLTSIEMPQYAGRIKEGAFEESALSSIDIFSNIYSIGNYAFRGCSNLSTVNVYRTDPPLMGEHVFLNCSTNLIIRVPTESLNKYRFATGWKDYSDKIVGW